MGMWEGPAQCGQCHSWADPELSKRQVEHEPESNILRQTCQEAHLQIQWFALGHMWSSCSPAPQT